jgi:hypothetical protein
VALNGKILRNARSRFLASFGSPISPLKLTAFIKGHLVSYSEVAKVAKFAMEYAETDAAIAARRLGQALLLLAAQLDQDIGEIKHALTEIQQHQKTSSLQR